MAKVDHKGRSQSGRFARFDHSVLRSAAYRSLTPNARSLLVELAMMENGKNNGELFLSVRDAADRMGVKDVKTASAAFDELERAGMIACTVDAHFAVKAGAGSRARCWRLTWQSTPALSAAPTRDFERVAFDPNTIEGKRADRGRRALAAFEKAQSRAQGNPHSLQSAVGYFPTLNPHRVGKNPTTNDADPPSEGALRGKISHAICEKRQKTAIVRCGKKPHTYSLPAGGDAGGAVIAPPIDGLGANDGGTRPLTKAQTDFGPVEPATVPKAAPLAGNGAAAASCERCGGDVPPGRQGVPKRFCTERCRKAAEKARHAQRKAEAERFGTQRNADVTLQRRCATADADAVPIGAIVPALVRHHRVGRTGVALGEAA